MKTPALVAAMTLLTGSLVALVYLAKTSAETVRPIELPQFGAALDRAAAAAHGQRLLVIERKAGVEPTSFILESSEGPTGWGAYPPTPDPDDPLVPALKNLGAAAAADFARERKLTAPTIRALSVFGVAVVVMGDGANVVRPEVGDTDAALGVATEVPALRIRKAEPVCLFLAEQPQAEPSDAVGFARTLRFGDADFLDDKDRAPWGGDVTVVASSDAEYLLPWTAAGARVTLDGKPATFRAARVPMLVVKVPKGRHAVSVRYGDDGLLRQAATVAAAAGVVVAFLALWLGLRPRGQS